MDCFYIPNITDLIVCDDDKVVLVMDIKSILHRTKTYFNWKMLFLIVEGGAESFGGGSV